MAADPVDRAEEVEGADEPLASVEHLPPDNPGVAGYPSRSEGRAEVARANEAPDASAERSEYPEVRDRSGYEFTDREYAFAEVTPDQVRDMLERRAPLGISPEQWATCVEDLHKALGEEDISDADVRLKGSAAQFCSYNPSKSFPQTEGDVRSAITDHHQDLPEDQRERRADDAVAVYRGAGFATDDGKPAAPFFDSMHKLGVADDPSDYDLQVASDQLAERFRQAEAANPEIGWRSGHGGHYKHRLLEQVAPALYDWSDRWQDKLGREVTIATFDSRGPAAGLRDSDWKLTEPEEWADR